MSDAQPPVVPQQPDPEEQLRYNALTPDKQAAVQRAQASRDGTGTLQAYDDDSQSLFEIPASEAKDYINAGIKVGSDAELAMINNGWEAKAGSALMGAARGASAGLSDLLVPDSARRLNAIADEAHPYYALGGEVLGSLPAFELAGGAAANLVPQYKAVAAAAGRVSLAAADAGMRTMRDSELYGTPLTAERLAQGIGMGALFGMGGESGVALAGKGLKAAKSLMPSAQRTLSNWVRRVGEKLDVVEEVGSKTGEVPWIPHDPTNYGSDVLSDEARSAFGMDKPIAAPSAKPPLLPMPSDVPPPMPAARRPIGKYTELKTEPQLEGFTPEEPPVPTGMKPLNQPMSEADATSGWETFDKEASDAARLGQTENAADYRAQRDAFSSDRGMGPDELADWKARRSEYEAPDKEFDGAFSRLTYKAPKPVWSEPADVLMREPALGPKPPPLPVREMPAFKPPRSRTQAPPPLRKLVNRDASDLLNGAEQPLPQLDELPRMDVPPSQRQYQLKPSQSKNMFEALGPATAGIAAAVGHQYFPGVIPSWLPLLGGGVAMSHIATQGGTMALRRAAAAVLRQSDATSNIISKQAIQRGVVSRLMDFGTRQTAKVAKLLLRDAPGISAVEATGAHDLNEAYQTLSDATAQASTDPTRLMDYYTQRYGSMFQGNEQLLSGLVQQMGSQLSYLQQQAPKDPRTVIGMFDEPYQPSRAEKLRFIDAFRAVNNPYDALMDPSMSSIQAIQATHPQTLALVQKMIMNELLDDKRRSRLSRDQRRRFSLILQAPVTAMDAPEFLSRLQAINTANATPAAPPPQAGGNQNRPNPPNFGATNEKAMVNQEATAQQQQQYQLN